MTISATIARDWFERGRELGSRWRMPLARQTMAGAIGQQLGSGVGSSLEFQDYREYHPGDDLRRLDWRVYARTDRLTVRLHREEVQPHLDLLVDCSRSMTAPSPSKAEAAMLLTGALAEAAWRSGLSVACLGFGQEWQVLFPKTTACPRFAFPDFSGTCSLPELFAHNPPRLTRRSLRVCLSDCLWETDPLPALRRLTVHAAYAGVINLLAAEELDPSALGPASLVDAETGARLDLQIGPAELTAYRSRLERHLRTWHEAAIVAGCRFVTLPAEALREGRAEALFALGLVVPG